MLVIPVGPFADQVARLLVLGGAYEVLAPDRIEDGFASRAAAVITVTWRACPSLWENADELAFRYAVPWLPVVMEHPRIRIGPWVDPRLGGPCHRCFLRRKVQHDGQRATSGTLEAAYDQDPGCGPRGYLPHHARAAAAVADITVRNGLLSGGLGGNGMVSVINVLTWQAATNHVVPVHGCGRCGQADRLGGGLTALLARVNGRERIA